MFMKLKLREGAARDGSHSCPLPAFGSRVNVSAWHGPSRRIRFRRMYAGRVFVLICAAGTGDSQTRKLMAILWRLAAGLVLHGLGEP